MAWPVAHPRTIGTGGRSAHFLGHRWILGCVAGCSPPPRLQAAATRPQCSGPGLLQAAARRGSIPLSPTPTPTASLTPKRERQTHRSLSEPSPRREAACRPCIGPLSRVCPSCPVAAKGWQSVMRRLLIKLVGLFSSGLVHRTRGMNWTQKISVTYCNLQIFQKYVLKIFCMMEDEHGFGFYVE